MPVVVNLGEVLGQAHDPNTWLDKSAHILSPDLIVRVRVRVRLRLGYENIKKRGHLSEAKMKISSKAQQNATGEDDPSAEDPLEGGPKGAEILADPISSDKLLQEVSLSPDLTKDQRRQLEEVTGYNTESTYTTESNIIRDRKHTAMTRQ
ncbi:hypothetical protein K435DRAFT_684153 [Dendrothele bispora CBS 962.96]|uniref:Uncharacterized protein n=1 Tax=Dendrothele bispora (strain CBS 962.96) TaxID=1314807 RepID=A0A4S8LBI2_DENBC|nr:hypothetical protein K435DRAFT_684153 [Dendrothele bispora CBS 962.96]